MAMVTPNTPASAPPALGEARYSAMLWNAPLSVYRAYDLLMSLDLEATGSLLDIGCGWGALLLAAAGIVPSSAMLMGIDNDASHIARARKDTKARSLENVAFLKMQAEEIRCMAERVICIGASHAFGGTRAMLKRLAEIVPRGKVSVGDMFWEKEPTAEAWALMGELPTLEGLVRVAREEGWEVLNVSVADQGEWDHFESSHRAGRREWCLRNPGDPRVGEVRGELDRKEAEYLNVYRGILGFAYLVLAR